MKKSIYLPLGMAVLALLGTGCTAEDPANGLDIDQTIFADGDGSSSGSTENPLKRYRISWYEYQNIGYNFDYTTSGAPISCEWSNYNSYGSDANYSFEYGYSSEYPSAVAWATSTRIENTYQDCIINTKQKIENLQFEGGLLKSLSYWGEKVTENRYDGTVKTESLPGGDVRFEYDEADHLVKIIVDDNIYDMVWDAVGNLTEVNSPYFGTSTIEYTDITNRYGQWDPTLPVMGFFQTFGWFGKAPSHFPSKIMTSASLFEGIGGDYVRGSEDRWYDLDYRINYEGLIETVKWSESLNNYKEVRINYLQVQ